MQQICSEGVVVNVVNYGDHDQVLTVFTRDHGVVKLIAKGNRRQHRRSSDRSAEVSPMTRGEFLYVQGNGELMRCGQIHVLDRYLSLRKTLAHLSAAGDCINVIRLSQLPGTPAPELYRLLLYYLERLPEMEDPQVLSCSYYLKVLKYEGVLSFQRYAFLSFSQQEQEQLQILTHSRSFADLVSMKLDEVLRSKVKKLFGLLLEKTLSV